MDRWASHRASSMLPGFDGQVSMDQLLHSLLELFTSLGNLIVALATLLVPLIPLAIWIAYWTLGVNWTRLRLVLLRGGWIGLLLLGLVAVMVWGTVDPPPSGYHQFLGLTVGNFVGKTVLVTVLICIMFLCGSVQLSGFCGSLCQFDEPPLEPEHPGGDHGHDGHGAHDPHVHSAAH